MEEDNEEITYNGEYQLHLEMFTNTDFSIALVRRDNGVIKYESTIHPRFLSSALMTFVNAFPENDSFIKECMSKLKVDPDQMWSFFSRFFLQNVHLKLEVTSKCTYKTTKEMREQVKEKKHIKGDVLTSFKYEVWLNHEEIISYREHEIPKVKCLFCPKDPHEMALSLLFSGAAFQLDFINRVLTSILDQVVKLSIY